MLQYNVAFRLAPLHAATHRLRCAAGAPQKFSLCSRKRVPSEASEFFSHCSLRAAAIMGAPQKTTPIVSRLCCCRRFANSLSHLGRPAISLMYGLPVSSVASSSKLTSSASEPFLALFTFWTSSGLQPVRKRVIESSRLSEIASLTTPRSCSTPRRLAFSSP